VDDLPAVVNALCDTNRREFRLAAIQSLPEMIARSPAALDEFITQLGRARLSKAQVETVATLLTGGSAPADPFDPDGLDRLVAGLASDALPVRELAYWVLTTDVDPAATRNVTLNRYNPAGSAEGREPFIRAWRARVQELKSKDR
jgi:hypothetical protein